MKHKHITPKELAQIHRRWFSVGMHLYSARIKCGVSRQLLAKKMGIHPVYLRDMEHGHREYLAKHINASLKALEFLCKQK